MSNFECNIPETAEAANHEEIDCLSNTEDVAICAEKVVHWAMRMAENFARPNCVKEPPQLWLSWLQVGTQKIHLMLHLVGAVTNKVQSLGEIHELAPSGVWGLHHQSLWVS